MKKYLESIHEKKKPFRCEMCGYSCPQKVSVKIMLIQFRWTY